ncbi:MAG: hypothetical protein ACLGIO_03415 [Acidimicrobiia bacterium]
MGRIYEDLEDHEGHVARYAAASPDTAKGASGGATHVPVCTCGWRGNAHPADDDGYDAALEEWDDRHAQPLLALTPPFELRQQAAEFRRGLAALVAERPGAALAAAEELQRWADALAARARAALHGPARTGRRLGR